MQIGQEQLSAAQSLTADQAAGGAAIPVSVPGSLPARPARASGAAQPVALERPVDRLSRWSLVLVLSVAVAMGLLYLVIVPPWQGPDEPSHFAYVALLDRYDLDNRAVHAVNVGEDRRQGDPALLEAVTASMERHGFARFV